MIDVGLFTPVFTDGKLTEPVWDQPPVVRPIVCYSETWLSEIIRYNDRRFQEMIDNLDVTLLMERNDRHRTGFQKAREYFERVSAIGKALWGNRGWEYVQVEIIYNCFILFLPFFFGWDHFFQNESYILQKLKVRDRHKSEVCSILLNVTCCGDNLLIAVSS